MGRLYFIYNLSGWNDGFVNLERYLKTKWDKSLVIFYGAISNLVLKSFNKKLSSPVLVG